MARRGRPRRNDEEREIRARRTSNRRDLLRRIRSAISGTPLTARDYALVAARVLHTLGNGTDSQKAQCGPLIKELREYDARANQPHKWDNDTYFLVDFIRKCAPGWEWWNDVARTGPERAERNINEMAEMRRHPRALRERFVTAGKPDPTMLLHMRKVKSRDATTWPTLRELKIATALSERKIKTILAKLRPKPSDCEIVKLPFRHVFTTRGSGNKRGGLPKRYHPRLVLAVIDVFIGDPADYPIGDEDSIADEEQKCVRKVAMTVKRALIQKLRASGSST